MSKYSAQKSYPTEIVETNKEGCNSSLFGCRMKTAKGNRIKIYFYNQTRSRYY